jgi:uncharacterized protein (TIGR02271 family)
MDVTRHEEEVDVSRSLAEAGRLGIQKKVESERRHEDVARNVERAAVERTPPSERDSGEIEHLPDGSISIPVFEEELVISKRTVVRERIVVRKETVTERERVEADLRREHVELETTGDVEIDDA